MKAKLAFYKGKGNIYDKLIRWWTKSLYSHVELVVDGLWYTSSPRDGGIRKKVIEDLDGNWDYLDVEIDVNYLNKIYSEYSGSKYDWLGIILCHVFPIGVEDRNKMFCSEFCGTVLEHSTPYALTPGDLYDIYK